MKQHITTKQLNELSKEGKEALMDWWFAKTDQNTNQKPRQRPTPLHHLPHLSIGQMIEFLDERNPLLWYIDEGIQKDKFGRFMIGDCSTDKDNLCDALWEAVWGELL